MPDNRSIGVFDSGIGGLTVLHALQQKLPGESTVYLGDFARFPYGTRPQAEVRQFATEIGDYFVRYDIKLLVVACNTATAAAHEHLVRRYPFPVVGVIQPAVQEALRISQAKRIGVIATDGTIRSGAYRRALLERLDDAAIEERAASWLVTLVEHGPTARPEIRERLSLVLAELRRTGIDTLILGCTHYPLVCDIFGSEGGPGLSLVDSASTTAREVETILAEKGMFASLPPSHRLLATGPTQSISETCRVMFSDSPEIELVDLSRTLIPGGT